jgi:hypothetical protein
LLSDISGLWGWVHGNKNIRKEKEKKEEIRHCAGGQLKKEEAAASFSN